MFEKVNPGHPDKVADRIAGAVVDLCYTKNKNPKVACAHRAARQPPGSQPFEPPMARGRL